MNETLDSRQLNAFSLLVKTGSYTETAKRLFLTHSAVSHSMRALEEQVGCRLFITVGKKIVPTEAGEALAPHAERVLGEMRRARLALAELNQRGPRRLRLAADAAFCSNILTPALLKFYREFPRFRIHVDVYGDVNPADLLAGNRADLVWAEKPPQTDGIEFVPVLADRFVFVVSPAHTWAARSRPPRAELASQPCLLLRGSSHGRAQLNEFLARQDIALNVAGEIERLDAVKTMVMQLPVAGFLPAWVVGAEIKQRALVALPAGHKPFEQTWGLIHSAARPLNHAESTFLKFCRQQVSELI